MILVTGATGTIGRAVAQLLLPGRERIRLVSRRPAALEAGLPGAEAVGADYGDPASLEVAMRGVRAMLLVTNRPAERDDARLLEAARAAGVRHVVKLSAAAVTDTRATDMITQWQRANETALRSSGMAWTLLRPRSFMSNTLGWAASIREHGTVRVLGRSHPSATVDPRDVAAVAACALTEAGHEGRTHTPTGPEAITPAEQTQQLAETLGTSLCCEEQSTQRARELLLRRHPAEVADALLAKEERRCEGAKATVEPTVLDVTGRPPRSFRTWASDHAQHFRAAGREAALR